MSSVSIRGLLLSFGRTEFEEPGDRRKQVRVMDYAAERNGRFLGGLFVSGFAL